MSIYLGYLDFNEIPNSGAFVFESDAAAELAAAEIIDFCIDIGPGTVTQAWRC